MFKRKYIFISGPCSMAMLDYRSVHDFESDGVDRCCNMFSKIMCFLIDINDICYSLFMFVLSKNP